MSRCFSRIVAACLMVGISLVGLSLPGQTESAINDGRADKPNSHCRTVKRWNNKGALGTALPGQNLVRCGKQPRCGAPVCSSHMTCAGALN